MGRTSNILSILAFILILLFIGWFGYTAVKYLQDNETAPTEQIGDAMDATLDKSKEVLHDAKSMAGNVKEGVSDLASDAKSKFKNTLSSKEKHQETEIDDLYDDEKVVATTSKSRKAEPIAKVEKKEVETPKIEIKVEKEVAKNSIIDEEALDAEQSAKSLMAAKEAELKAAAKKTAEKAAIVNEKPSRTTEKTVPQEYAFTEKLDPASTDRKYLVLAGAFAVAQNADEEASRLQKLGYTKAETISFASTKYKNVCVQKFAKRSEADALVGQLKKQGISAYVHTKRKK